MANFEFPDDEPRVLAGREKIPVYMFVDPDEPNIIYFQHNDKVEILGTFSKQETKENKERVYHFFYNLPSNYKLEIPVEKGYKINSIDGNSCYKNTYKFVIKRENIKFASDDEAGIEAKVLDIVKYGNVTFAKVEAEGNEFLITVGAKFKKETVKIKVEDASVVEVYSTKIDMKVC